MTLSRRIILQLTLHLLSTAIGELITLFNHDMIDLSQLCYLKWFEVSP